MRHFFKVSQSYRRWGAFLSWDEVTGGESHIGWRTSLKWDIVVGGWGTLLKWCHEKIVQSFRVIFEYQSKVKVICGKIVLEKKISSLVTCQRYQNKSWRKSRKGKNERWACFIVAIAILACYFANRCWSCQSMTPVPLVDSFTDRYEYVFFFFTNV